VRPALIMTLVTLALGGIAALAGQESGPASPSAKPAPVAKTPDRDQPAAVEREAVALAFVRENHPELALLLEPLKTMNPAQYQKAIADLYQVSRNLANLAKNDPKRYEAGLAAWKARSRVEVIAASLASTPSTELESQLRVAIENHVEAQLNMQRVERSFVQERLKKLNESIERLESNRNAVIESRYQALIKKGQRTRRLNEGQPAPAKSARSKGENTK
jgi:hypothetical protein